LIIGYQILKFVHVLGVLTTGPGGEVDLVTFPAHALLVLEERLKEHQADGTLDLDADVTRLARVAYAGEHPAVVQVISAGGSS
jgi:hypothetical protein